MVWSRAVLSALAVLVASAAVFAGVRASGPVRVAGGSMRPALLPGDLCFVDRGAEVQVGDIALVEAGQGRSLHRVVKLETDGSIVTKGDANTLTDSMPVEREYVRGRVSAVLRIGSLVERWRGLRLMRYTLGSNE